MLSLVYFQRVTILKKKSMKFWELDIFKNVQNGNIEKVFYFAKRDFCVSLIDAVKTNRKIFMCDGNYFYAELFRHFFVII